VTSAIIGNNNCHSARAAFDVSTECITAVRSGLEGAGRHRVAGVRRGLADGVVTTPSDAFSSRRISQ